MGLLLALLLAQTTPIQPMPKGTGLPPPGTEEAAVMAPVNALLAALATRNGAAVLPYVLADGGIMVASEKPDGARAVRRSGWAAWVASITPGTERYEQRLYDPAVEIDGDVAMVWGRYDFRVDGKIAHCGYDHVDLVRDGGRWKIANLSYSMRTTGCEAL
ncbi:nuclear transport factor 2 family protein [Sphingomonas endolithica]|uniref:nuclear transport factor 2 family protein n=1 Tax=Sphingomonas endolithica TaxID=2972485 RepID=UPI0021AFE949|nr:nuclear transport factor 2 family protein [Sphingomonas sp. ZFBP2030]